MNKIILLDSNSLLHRAYYALAASNLTDSKGNPTGAVYGFVSMLAKLIHEEKPTHIVAAFDLKGPTFRHEMYAAYKGTRKPMPEDLVPQVDMLKNLLRAFGIKILELQGYEADDVIGTMAKRFDEPTIIVTGDRDSFQLIDDSTVVHYTKRGISDIVCYTEELLREEGYPTPHAIIDYKSLRGDASDNIPGIVGIGEKTALQLIADYGTLDNLYAHAAEIGGKLGEKIRDGEESARLSYTLATINTDVPIEATLEDIAFNYPLPESAKDVMQALEFSTLIKRFDFGKTAETVVEVPKKEVLTIEINELEKIKQLARDNKNKPCAISVGEDFRIAFDSDTEYKITSSYDLFGGTTPADIAAALSPVLENDKDKIVLDYKKLLHDLSGFGVSVGGKIYDANLLGYLVFGGRTFADVQSLNAAFGFSGDSLASLFDVMPTILNELHGKGLDDLYYDMELPLETVLFKMELAGVKVDKVVLNEFKKRYGDELETLTDDIYKYAGETFNINSPKQLTVILFEKLGLKAGKKNKTGMSVNIDVLTKLYDEHPIIPLIIRYRQLSKLQSTYVYGLEKEIAADGRIHTDYKQTVTNTGRLSSTEPNLQNIPTRTSEGKEIRRAFIADEGKVLISADYSQIELRLMAHMSGDKNLIAAYNESRDIHTSTAAEIYGVPPSEVTANMRRDAKAVNFGIIYGISDFGLAQNLSIRPKQAKAYIEKYFETYPRVKDFMDGLVREAEENGMVRTLFGRIRIMSELKSSNYAVREFGKRAAMNFPLQGTAADIIKFAMLEVDKKLSATNARLLLQVHDELIVESPADEAEEVKTILVDCMENAVKLSVPLTVNVSEGKSWYEA